MLRVIAVEAANKLNYNMKSPNNFNFILGRQFNFCHGGFLENYRLQETCRQT